MRAKPSCGFVLACLTAVATTACTSDSITIGESDVLMPTVRLTLPERRGRSEKPTRLPTDRLAELTGSVAYDDIGPPDTGHFSMLELTAAYRHSTFGTERASLDVIAGLGFNKLRIQFENSSNKFDRDISRFGPLIGGELSYKPLDWLTVYGRGTFLLLIPDGTSGQAETGLQFAIGEQVNFMAAWRHWRYRNDDLTGLTNLNDLDIKANGFVFGFVLNF